MATDMTTPQLGQQAALDQSSMTQQFIAFRLGKEEYGIEILAIWEIKGCQIARDLPNAPDYVRGVIDFRGIIVPVCDLRVRFGGNETEITRSHVVIIVKTNAQIYGLLVDEISDIITITKDQIKPAPQIDASGTSPFLQGLVTINERMVTLLNHDCLFGQGQPANLQIAAS